MSQLLGVATPEPLVRIAAEHAITGGKSQAQGGTRPDRENGRGREYRDEAAGCHSHGPLARVSAQAAGVSRGQRRE